MRYSTTLALTILLSAPSLAQTSPAVTGDLQVITIVGADQFLSDYIASQLTENEGNPLSSINLRSVEKEVLGTGYVKTVVAEIRTIAGKNTLYITVVANPAINAVNILGMTYLSADDFKQRIDERYFIASTATLNT